MKRRMRTVSGARGTASPHDVAGDTSAAALVVASLIGIQAGGAVAKGLFSQVAVPGVVTLRLGVAALLLLALHRPPLAVLRERWTVVVPAGAVIYLHHLCFYEAIDRIPLGTATTIEFVGPFLLSLWLSDRWKHRAWACLALAGVVILCRPSLVTDWIGIGCAFVAAAAWAGYIVLARRLGERAPGQALALTIATAAVLSLPAGAAALAPHLGDPTVWGVGACVALMSSVLPYSLQLRALRGLSPRSFSVLLSLEPAVAAVVGVVLLHQALPLLQWAGIAAVVAASVGATRGPGDRSERRPALDESSGETAAASKDADDASSGLHRRR
jgi:inner membrane transporter RhtA